jgi:hypothetical protein
MILLPSTMPSGNNCLMPLLHVVPAVYHCSIMVQGQLVQVMACSLELPLVPLPPLLLVLKLGFELLLLLLLLLLVLGLELVMLLCIRVGARVTAADVTAVDARLSIGLSVDLPSRCMGLAFRCLPKVTFLHCSNCCCCLWLAVLNIRI